ncbi:hypothetical protein RCL1_003497 [Eukaryota sp. TZLM3-RCL]
MPLIRIRNEPACVNLACSVAGCNFSLYASRKKNLPSVIIRRFSSHSCLDNPLIPATFSIPSTKILGNLTEVKEEVAKNALIPAKKIAEVIAKACGVALDDISAQKALRARNIARIHVYGSFEDYYADLPRFIEELQIADSGGYFVFEVDNDQRFLRCFIAFSCSIKAFYLCKNLLALDGAHLHGKYKGIMLGATTIDGQGSLFPIAIAFVNQENKENWLWFVRNLKYALNNERLPTFISDRQKGLLDAIAEIFPESPHAFCVRHLAENLAKKCGKKEVIEAVWDAAKCRTVDEVESAMTRIRTHSERAYQFLKDVGVEHWTTAYFPANRYGHVTSNIAESLNSWMGSLRGLPIIHLEERYKGKLQEWINERREMGLRWKKENLIIVKAIREQVQNNQKKSGSLKVVITNSEERRVAEVVDGVYSSAVNLDERTCTCKNWERNGFPCPHGCAVYKQIGEGILCGIEKVYLVTTFIETYSNGITPIKQKTDWRSSAEGDLVPLPPVVKKAAGRPRRKRVDVFKAKRKRLGQHVDDINSLRNVPNDDRWLLGEIIEADFDDAISDSEDENWKFGDVFESSETDSDFVDE